MGQHNPVAGQTGHRWVIVTLCALGVSSALVEAQTTSSTVVPDWRRIGNPAILRGLASPAGGRVDRVWFSPDGLTLTVRTGSGRLFQTRDFQVWKEAPANTAAPVVEAVEAISRPEPGAAVRGLRRRSAVIYSFGDHLWRSDNEGEAWQNVTRWKQSSILGGRVLDMSVSSADEQRIAAATDSGVWLSQDGGLSWVGLNENLPNLDIHRILSVPQGSRGIRILAGGSEDELEWYPGQRQGWVPGNGNAAAELAAQKARWSSVLQAPVTAVASSGDSIYAGAADGRLWASIDRGQTWRFQETVKQRVEAIWTAPSDSRLAIAVLAGEGAGRVFRTVSGGASWDDLTSNLTGTPLLSVAADRASGAIYVGTERGVLFTVTDLKAPVPPTEWVPLGGIPAMPVRDLRLDDAGNQLFAAVQGYGIYAALAPHRSLSPTVVHSADYRQRAAAPGALLSVLGLSVNTARAGAQTAPVLSRQSGESQIQVPFEVQGGRLALTLESRGGTVRIDLPVETTAPAVLVDRDGSPMLLDGDSGLQVDAMNPAKPGMRLQILASGLGRVSPAWPTGLAAPLEASPAVVAPVRVLMDGAPLEVVRATLAPGYIGYYLVEIQIPEFVNAGAAELLLEVAGRPSNRVRLYLDR